MAIKFNGIEIPSFVKVNNIANSILPSISQTTMKINGKAGMQDFGNEIGTRNIAVTITIIANDQSDLRMKVRDLAEWLYYEEEKKFIDLSEPNIYYMAKFTGDSTLSEILHVGQGTLNFICNNPFAYNTVERNYQFMPTENAPYGFENNGNTETYPRMEFEFTDNATEFSIVTNDEYLYFGKPLEAGISEPIDANPVVFNEEFSNLNGWTQAVSVADGTIAGGGFVSNGWSISVQDFGEGTGWHGSSMIKSLPYELQDFKIRSRIGLLGTKPEQLGRIEVYGLDINGNKIFRQQFRDGNVKAISPYAYATIGNKEIVGTYGSYMGVWAKAGDLFMDIARRGNSWGLYWAIYDPVKKIQHTQYYKGFVDIKNEHMAKLASIQIHIGAYADVEPVQMYIQTVKVYDENPVPVENEVPYIVKAGDILVVDNETGGIWLNGEEFYHYLDPASKFVKFRKGINGVWVSPLVVTNGKVSYRERWL